MDLLKNAYWIIGLLSACTTVRFGQSLAANSGKNTKCVSRNNQRCKARPTLVDITSNKTLFYTFTVSVNKWNGSSYTNGDSHDRVFVPNKVKKILI